MTHFFCKRTSTSGPEAQLFLISTLIVTLLREKGNICPLQMITNDTENTFLKSVCIRFRDKSKIETCCSYTIVRI